MAVDLIRPAIMLGLLLAAAKLGEDIASRFRVPSFIGAVLAGYLLGPGGLGVIELGDIEALALILTIGINFTLFLGGVEELSNPRLFKPGRREVFAASLVLTIPTLAIAYYAAMFMGIETGVAIAFASALAIVSLGPLMKLLIEVEHGIDEKALKLLRVGLLVELIGIMLFNSFFKGFDLVKLVETIGIVVIVLILGKDALYWVLTRVEKYIAAREAPFAIIVALVIMAGYIAEEFGFNAAVMALLLGAFASEYLLARPAYLERIRAFTYGFLEPLFFAGVGLYVAKPSLESILLAVFFYATVVASRIMVKPVLDLPLKDTLALTAKGGIDAAMLMSLAQTGAIVPSIYTGAVTALLALTLTAALTRRAKKPPAPEFWRLRVGDLPLDHAVVHYQQHAIYAARLVSRKGAAVVVDDDYHPIGYVVAEDFVEIDPKLLEEIPTLIFSRPEIQVVTVDTLVAELLQDIARLHEPILAVTDKRGIVVGTLTPSQILRLILEPSGRKPEHEDHADRSR